MPRRRVICQDVIIMLLQRLTGIESPYIALSVVFASIFAVFWVLDLYGIINFAAWFGFSGEDSADDDRTGGRKPDE